MLELRNKLLLLGLEGEASLIPTFTLDPRLIGGVCGKRGISKGSETGGFDVNFQFSGLELFPTGYSGQRQTQLILFEWWPSLRGGHCSGGGLR